MAELGAIKSHSIQLPIKDPATGAMTGLVLTLRPMDDPVLRNVRERSKTRGFELLQKRKVPDSVEREDHANRTAIAAIEAWQWGEDDDGKPATWKGEQPALSRDAVLSIIEDFPNFREQIENAYEDETAFFR